MFRSLLVLVFMLGLGATAALAQSAADVKLVQEELSDYGAGKADGEMGKKTRNAIRAYQQDWQIPETGEITPDLIARLKGEHPATRSQWTKTANQDCEVWNESPTPREVVTWTGDCSAGKTSGTGKVVWSFEERGKKLQDTYEGQRKDGKKHGQGVYTGADGNRYEGQFKDNKQHGQGVYTGADGSRYEGQWKDNNYHGQGVYTEADGDRYEGQWKDNKQHGQGVITWADGDRYEGQYKDGKKHGQGVYTWADGDRYEGQYKDGKPHGQGVFTWADGRRENRHWNNGCSAGKRNRWIGTSKKACGF